ncbi:MAG: single-stranded DNA-binding protein [Candidatus Dormibacteria bacterium]
MPRKPAATAQAPAPPAGAPGERRRTGPALNRVDLIGRVAAAPELRFTSSGLPVCTLRIATNAGDNAEFHDVVVWRHLAEFAGQYLAKGRLVYVQGRLHGRSWQADNNTTRRSVEVIAEDLQVLDRRLGNSEPAAEPAEC